MCIFKFDSGTTPLNQNRTSLLLLLNSIVLLSSARQKAPPVNWASFLIHQMKRGKSGLETRSCCNPITIITFLYDQLLQRKA